MVLKDYQLRAVEDMFTLINESESERVVFSSCTGSGKTAMLASLMEKHFRVNKDAVILWLTPGRGKLAEQSLLGVSKYKPLIDCKTLQDAIISGFEKGSAYFINWEKLTNKNNKVNFSGERSSFDERVDDALLLNRGDTSLFNDNSPEYIKKNGAVEFLVIIDESHISYTDKSIKLIKKLHPKSTIFCSATPKKVSGASEVIIKESDVISSGLIKRMISINGDVSLDKFNDDDDIESVEDLLIKSALAKQSALLHSFREYGINVNPLILIQLEDGNEEMKNRVVSFLSGEGITLESGLLAIHLSNEKENIDNIKEINAKQKVLVMKQAVSTGWDCPRSYILVKLRPAGSESFSIQTIGRIRRMPEARHYDDELLDACYLYSNDAKYVSGVQSELGTAALPSMFLNLKEECKNICLYKEIPKPGPRNIGDDIVSEVIYTHFINEYALSPLKFDENKECMLNRGYKFYDGIERRINKGMTDLLTINKLKNLDSETYLESVVISKHLPEYVNVIDRAASISGISGLVFATISKLMFIKNKDDNSLFNFSPTYLCSFFINNKWMIIEDVKKAMSSINYGCCEPSTPPTERLISLLETREFSYDSNAKNQVIMKKNMYEGYRHSILRDSKTELDFELFCESNDNIIFIMKNGDFGKNHLSIVYEDNFGRQRCFYPDYILQTSSGRIWIIEVKGTFKGKADENIDIFMDKKFEILKAYIGRHGKLSGAFVRSLGNSGPIADRLKICTTDSTYDDDVSNANSWDPICDVL